MTDSELLSHFQRNPDGTWTTIKGIQINSSGGSISAGPGMTFGHGVSFGGVNLAAELDAAAARLGR